jgi:hypothetical protein
LLESQLRPVFCFTQCPVLCFVWYISYFLSLFSSILLIISLFHWTFFSFTSGDLASGMCRCMLNGPIHSLSSFSSRVPGLDGRSIRHSGSRLVGGVDSTAACFPSLACRRRQGKESIFVALHCFDAGLGYCLTASLCLETKRG